MDKNRFYKDIAKEMMLEEINKNMEGKSANDVSRVRFLKDNIDEVVSVMLAGEANRKASLSKEYELAKREYGIEFACAVKDKIMQETYESFGYEEKLPTSAEIDKMRKRHINTLNYLRINGASSEYIEIVKASQQLEIDLLECKRGELYNQFCAKDGTFVKISYDVLLENHEEIKEAKKKYNDKHMKVRSKK